MNRLGPSKQLLLLTALAIAACTRPSAPTGSPTLANTTPAMSSRTAQPAALPEGEASKFEFAFETYDAEVMNHTQVRAKLRLKTSRGDTFTYKMPVSHLDCYFYSGGHSDFVDGDEAELICSGGAEHDLARLKRKSDTLVEVSFYQQAFAGPDTPSNAAAPYNEQTFSIPVPKGAKIHAIFKKGAAPDFDPIEFESFRDSDLGIAFRYSPTFNLKQLKTEGVIQLDSGYWVDEPHALADPGRDTKQHFRGILAVRDNDVEACIQQDSTFVHDNAFKNGTFQEQAGFAEKRAFGGKSGIVILTGAHGYYKRQYYISLSPKRTVVASFDIVGDSVQTNKKGPPAAKQIAMVEAIVGSISPVERKR